MLQQTNRYLWLIILVSVVLYFGQAVLIPLFLGALFAMLMAPLCRKLDKKMNRGFSSFICTAIVLVSLLILIGVAAWQLATLVDDLPAVKERSGKLLTEVEKFIQTNFSVSPAKQESIAQKQLKSIGQSAGSYAGKCWVVLHQQLHGLCCLYCSLSCFSSIRNATNLSLSGFLKIRNLPK